MNDLQDAPIILTAGGTGGHMFPAEALAQELRARGRTVMLITDTRGAAYAASFGNIETHVIAASNPAGNLWVKIRAAAAIGIGVVQAWRVLRRRPAALVVGFGGYPALPAMAAAIWLGVPTALHEQNAVLGRVNRLIARWVTRIAASVDDLRGLRAIDRVKVTVTGNPVRAGIAACHGRVYEAPQLDAPFNLVIFGGSQGARILSDAVPAAAAMLPPGVSSRLRVVQQCRSDDLERVRMVYARAGVQAELMEFISDMPAKLANAHLVIARSGATTVSELTAAGVPSILVPYPHHADQQQLANAEALASVGAAWVLPEAELTSSALAKRLQNLLRNPQQLAVAAAAAHGLGRPDAARALADMVERLAPRNSAYPGSGGGGNGSSNKVIQLFRRAAG
jgi:UDP-N-acetylglucosamine--N-acetylmuramyl-(pentapeptide) pyrophosphoryl-undecaprenol N-acetylglucosamine transferase